jgi:hypothetical protein
MQKQFKIVISDYVIDRIKQFRDYLIDDYVGRFSETWLFVENILISNYISTQNNFVDKLFDTINEHFNCEVIPKFQPVSDWIIESYYTYVNINNYSVKLTCIQNNENRYILIEDIIIYSK